MFEISGRFTVVSDPYNTLDDREWVEFGPCEAPPDFEQLSWSELPAEGWVGDALAELCLTDCSAKELLDAAATWERLSAWVAGHQARIYAEFASRRAPEPAESDDRYVFPEEFDADPDIDESAADELSLALRVAPVTAKQRMGFGRDLAARLPGTLRALCAGSISVSKARILAEQSDNLTAEQTTELERCVLSWGSRKTPGQFRRRVRREILRIDATAVHRRTAAAIEQRTIELMPLPDGMARLSCELPGPDAVAAYNWLDQQARVAKSAGDDRSLNQLRADAFVDLVTQRSTSVACKPLVQVLVPLSTLAGGDAAAELSGYGPIDAELARQLAADGTWQRLLTDPVTGAVREVDPGRYSAPAALRTFVRARDRTCRFPTCSQPAHRCEIDHTVRYGEKTASGPTRPDNLGALCRHHHRLKDQPGTGWRLKQKPDGEFVWTTPEGWIYRVPPGSPLEPVADPAPSAAQESEDGLPQHSEPADDLPPF